MTRLSALLRLALAGLCVIVGIGTASADYVIKKDLGGNPHEYWQKFVAVRNSGERVVIDGICGSACTIVIQVIPRERICVTSNASLAFHAARFKGTQVVHDELTEMYFKKSPPDFQKWMLANNVLGSLKVKELRGVELETFIQRCPPELYYSPRPIPVSAKTSQTTGQSASR